MQNFVNFNSKIKVILKSNHSTHPGNPLFLCSAHTCNTQHYIYFIALELLHIGKYYCYWHMQTPFLHRSIFTYNFRTCFLLLPAV